MFVCLCLCVENDVFVCVCGGRLMYLYVCVEIDVFLCVCEGRLKCLLCFWALMYLYL